MLLCDSKMTKLIGGLGRFVASSPLFDTDV
jgi:hypothetical protein